MRDSFYAKGDSKGMNPDTEKCKKCYFFHGTDVTCFCKCHRRDVEKSEEKELLDNRMNAISDNQALSLNSPVYLPKDGVEGWATTLEYAFPAHLTEFERVVIRNNVKLILSESLSQEREKHRLCIVCGELEDLLDEHFPKLNEGQLEIPSANNRAAALVFYAQAKMLFREELSSQRSALIDWARGMELHEDNMHSRCDKFWMRNSSSTAEMRGYNDALLDLIAKLESL